jgi:hypothetical protein
MDEIHFYDFEQHRVDKEKSSDLLEIQDNNLRA